MDSVHGPVGAAAKPFDWRNLGIRVASAAVLAPVALLGVWVGDWVFLLILSVAMAVLALEWGRMCAPESRTRSGSVVLVGVLAGLFALYAGYPHAGWLVLVLAAILVAIVTRAIHLSRRPTDTAFGVLYLGAPAMALFWLRNGDDGRSWTFLMLCIAWAADSAAFLAGSVLKGPKLWPRFSPNKTWSGFVAGLLAGVAAAGAYWMVFMRPAAPIAFAAVLVVGLIGALATMGGDLLESMLKRRFGVKDSGDLIPGHGGLLDRVDGLLFAVLAVAGARLLAEARVFD